MEDIKDLRNLITEENEKLPVFEQPFYNRISGEYHLLVEDQLRDMTTRRAINTLISQINYYDHRDEIGGHQGEIHEQDVWFVDFGNQYIRENSFCHPAIVLCVVDEKALVVPMVSKCETSSEGGNSEKKMVIQWLDKTTMKEKSGNTAYVNDAKFVNTCRFLKNIGEVTREDFKKIKMMLLAMLM